MWKPIQSVLAIKAFAALVKDPSRLDQVFEISDALASPKSMKPMLDFFRAQPGGEKAFRDRYRLPPIDLQELRKLPKGTLGREFAEHMIANNLDPAALPLLESHDDPSYMRAHMYEAHDILHVVTDHSTDIPGELGLQAFYLAQFPALLSSVLLAMGFLHLALYKIDARDRLMDAIMRGYNMGRAAKPFFGVRWGDLWEKPLEEVRAMLDVNLGHSTEDVKQSGTIAHAA